MPKKSKQRRRSKFEVPKGPCEPEPPRHPPPPKPTKPWDRLGPDPIEWLKIGKKKKKKS